MNSIRVAVITISDTRTEKTDQGGKTICEMMKQAGHQIENFQIVKDEVGQIQNALSNLIKNKDANVIVTTGGTGIAKRDVSLEAVEPFYEKTIDGFGELFRYLSYTKDVGTKAMMSRASAGVKDDIAIFVLPGSVKAVKLAMDELILPELKHVYHELTK